MERTTLNKVLEGKTLRYTFFLLLALFVGTFLVVQGFIVYHGQKKETKKPDVLIILGAKLYGERPSPALLRRLETGLELLRAHPNALVIVSGGQGADELISEAEAMKRYLLEQGIEEHRILLEDASTSTYENMKNSMALLKEASPEDSLEALSFGVVTNDFHIFRSVLTAKEMGMKAFGIPAKTPPSITVTSHLREYLSVLKYLLLDRQAPFFHLFR